VDFLKPDSSNN